MKVTKKILQDQCDRKGIARTSKDTVETLQKKIDEHNTNNQPKVGAAWVLL